MKINTLYSISLICLSFFLVSFSNDIILPLGSRVSREGIQKIMSAESVGQFIEAIENGESLKVIAIDKRIGERIQTTISEDHWALPSEEAEMLRYFNEAERRLGFVVALYVPRGSQMWSQNYHVLLVYRDISLSILIHEYLHYLIATGPNNIETPFHEEPIHKHELYRIAREQLLSFVASRQRYKESGTIENRVSYYMGHSEVSLSDFLATNALNLEEMEIDLFLLFRRKLLNISRHDTWLMLVDFRSSGQRLYNTKTAQQRLDVMSRFLQELEGKALLSDVQLEAFRNRRNRLRSGIEDLSNFHIPPSDDVVALRLFNKQLPGIVGDTTCDGLLDKRDLDFLNAVIEDPTALLNYAEHLQCDLNKDGQIDRADAKLLSAELDNK